MPVLLCDLGNVLIGVSLEPVLRAWRELNGGTIALTAARDLEDDAYRGFETGALGESEYARHLRVRLGWRGSDPDLVSGWGQALGAVDLDVLQLLGELRAEGWTLIGATNVIPWLEPELWRRFGDTLSVFHRVVASTAVGVRKPDPRFFAEAVRESGPPGAAAVRRRPARERLRCPPGRARRAPVPRRGGDARRLPVARGAGAVNRSGAPATGSGGADRGPSAADGSVRALQWLAAVPEVAEAVEGAGKACTELRWHPALRRRAEEARAEAGIRAARCAAALSGARLPVAMVRDAARGATQLPADAAGRAVHGALRAVAEAGRLGAGSRWQLSPHQALARLHVAVAAGLVEPEQLGRPRPAGLPPQDGADLLLAAGEPVVAPDGPALADRIAALATLLAAPPEVPATVVAALAFAEVAVARPFVAGNVGVAAALARAVVVSRGLDPTGVAVWEAGLLDAGPEYGVALSGYAGGDPAAVTGWLQLFARSVTAGAGEGRAVCDAVLAGRLHG